MGQQFLEKVLWALLVVVLWVVKELVTYIVKQRKEEYKKSAEGSGDLPESRWILNITRIVQDENEKLRVRLKEEIERNGNDTVKAHQALQAAVATAEINIIKAVIKNGH